MPKDKWTTETKAGYSFDVLLQGEQANCGLCCCAMVVNLKGQGQPDSQAVQGVMGPGAYIKSHVDRAGLRPTPLVGLVAAPKPVDAGTELQGLSQALSAYKIRNTPRGGGPLKNALLSATKEQPVIVQVKWSGGGFHWVVIARSMGPAQIVLDPVYGLHINHSVEEYAEVGSGGAYGHGRTVHGRWQEQWLKVH